ncbi:MAG: Lrp/AsnC family transcriptional regulator [Candidatus Aenigmarchaeota archaeon]|nr:Lrp/AsnC family transcriptional regulator [Candidatus Aenigmarchaeota archaeon]
MVRISNLKILELLKRNSRMSFVEMAKKLGVSETAVRKKIKRLESDGVIKKYTIETDPRKIGFDIDALIGIDTEPEYYISTLERLKQTKEVIGLCSSSGDHMILAECWFKNSNELAKFIKKLEKSKGIIKICPAIILEKIK